MFNIKVVFLWSVASILSCSSVPKKTEPDKILHKYTLANQLRFDYFDTGIRHRLDNLKGNIFSMTHYDESPNNDSLEFNKDSYKFFFDTNGIITQKWMFNSWNNPRNKIWYRDYLNKKRDSIESYNEDGTLAHGAYYSYDSYGILRSTKILNRDKSIKLEKYPTRQNEDTLILEYKDFIKKYKENKLIQLCQTKNNNVIENYDYYPDGVLRKAYNLYMGFNTSVRNFDKQGYPILTEGFEIINKNLNQIQGRKMEFNDERRLESIKSYSTLKKKYIRSSKQIYKNGQIILTLGTNDTDTAAVYSYNDKGDLLEKKSFFNIEIYKYLKYDSIGNWIKREHYLNNELWEVETREFEYY